MDIPNGIRGWFDHFDEDKSDELELKEFINMIRYLKIEVSDRFGIMIFRLLDRENIGCFNYATLRDILMKIMKPNYKRIIKEERARFALNGLQIEWPKRKKPGQEVIVK